MVIAKFFLSKQIGDNRTAQHQNASGGGWQWGRSSVSIGSSHHFNDNRSSTAAGIMTSQLAHCAVEPSTI